MKSFELVAEYKSFGDGKKLIKRASVLPLILLKIEDVWLGCISESERLYDNQYHPV